MWRSDQSPTLTDQRTIKRSQTGAKANSFASVYSRPLLPPPPENFVKDFETLAINREEPSQQTFHQGFSGSLIPIVRRPGNPFLPAVSEELPPEYPWEAAKSSPSSSIGSHAASQSVDCSAETQSSEGFNKVISEEPPLKRPKLQLQEPYIFNQGKTIFTQCNAAIENETPSYTNLSAMPTAEETPSSCLDPCNCNSYNHFPSHQ